MKPFDRKTLIAKARRIVIKVGSAVLTGAGEGLDQKRIEQLAAEVSAIMDRKCEVVLVSSGAIAAGLAKLGIRKTKGMPLPLKQAAAAVGQSGLMWMYDKTFSGHGKKVAQVLLTREDLSSRTRFLNARNTLQTLLEYGVVPIINENDTPDSLVASTTAVGDYDLVIWGWGSDPDPNLLLSVMTTDEVPTGSNETGYANSEFDSLYYEQASEFDLKRRKEMVWQIQHIVFDDVVYIIPYYAQNVQAYRKDRFTGFVDQPKLELSELRLFSL